MESCQTWSRVQAEAITAFTAKRMELLEAYSGSESDKIAPEAMLTDCRKLETLDVAEQTLRRWWEIYEEWGELPHHVYNRKKERSR